MPTRQQVWSIADKLRAKPERVSLRSVRAQLPGGGSFRDIGEHLAAWKAERQYQPRIELSQLPEFLQTDLGRFGKLLWDAAMQEATRQFNVDRARCDELIKAERELRQEALIAADLLEERLRGLVAENRRLKPESEIDGLRLGEEPR